MARMMSINNCKVVKKAILVLILEFLVIHARQKQPQQPQTKQPDVAQSAPSWRHESLGTDANDHSQVKKYPFLGGRHLHKVNLHEIQIAQQQQHHHHDDEQQQQQQHSLDSSNTSSFNKQINNPIPSPFLSSTLRIRVFPVPSPFDSARRAMFGSALMHFLEKVFGDQQVYDVVVLSVNIFDERFDSGSRRSLSLKQSSSQKSPQESTQESLQKSPHQKMKNRTTRTLNKLSQRVIVDSDPKSSSISFDMVVAAEHQRSNIDSERFGQILIHVLQKFHDHLIIILKDTGDPFFMDVQKVAVESHQQQEEASVDNMLVKKEEEEEGMPLASILGIVLGSIAFLSLFLLLASFQIRRKEKLSSYQWKTKEIIATRPNIGKESSSFKSWNQDCKSRDDYSFSPFADAYYNPYSTSHRLDRQYHQDDPNDPSDPSDPNDPSDPANMGATPKLSNKQIHQDEAISPLFPPPSSSPRQGSSSTSLSNSLSSSLPKSLPNSLPTSLPSSLWSSVSSLANGTANRNKSVPSKSNNTATTATTATLATSSMNLSPIDRLEIIDTAHSSSSLSPTSQTTSYPHSTNTNTTFSSSSPTSSTYISNTTTTTKRQHCYAPPGKVGVAIDTVHGQPIVHKVKRGSPLEGQLHPMDIVVAIDDVDTSHMSAADVTQLMVKRMNYRRKITFERTL